jgi:CHAT domain-containing protein
VQVGPGADLHADALARLVSGETDVAVRDLLGARAARPNDAELAGDLAAVYLVRAGEADDPGDLARAVEAASEAVALDAELARAWFNLGLALARLGLTADAATALAKSRALEGDPGWAAEARDREKALVVPPTWKSERLEAAALTGSPATLRAQVAANRQAAREHVERTLLGRWGDAVATGDLEGADRHLAAARAIAAALVELGGDRLAADAVAAIDRRRRDSSSLAELAQAHRVLRDGYELYRDRRTNDAVGKLRKSSAMLSRLGSPLALTANLYVASSLYLQGDLPAARQGLAALAATPYPAWRAHVRWIQALGSSFGGASDQAVASFEEALALFRRLDERENAAAVETQLGELFHRLGRRSAGWQRLYRALLVTAGYRDPALASLIFKNAAECALAEGLPRTALAFHDEVVRRARHTYPMRSSEALLARAEASARLGRHEDALRDLREAEATIPQITDEALRARKQAEHDLIRGTLLTDSEPELAVESLSAALASFAAEKNLLATLRVRLARARAFGRLGQRVREREDLHASLGAYERLGANLEPGLWLSYLAVTDRLFDELIGLTADRPEISFGYAERARVRLVPGQKAKRPPLGLADLAPRLPADTVLVEYALLEDRLVTWVVSGGGSIAPFHLVTPVARQDVEQLVSQVRSWDGATRTAGSRRMFDLLVMPWIERIGAGARLVFVPDKALHGVPFSALVDQRSGGFLVEGHAVVAAASASLYVAGLAVDRGVAPADRQSALVLGDPAFEGDLYPVLDRLGGAAQEADQIASLWEIEALKAESATKEAFLAAAPFARVVHVASHAVIDPKDPLLSALLLAPSAPGDSGVLTAGEIYSLRLQGVELVVLSGCDTGTLAGSEGVTSLARAFHAAGVPTVVASLWKVDDLAATGFLLAFHRNLRAGLDPAAALRQAQLSFKRSQDEGQRSPATWAAFVVIGAGHRDN